MDSLVIKMIVDILKKKEIKEEKAKYIASNEIIFIHKDIYTNAYDSMTDEEKKDLIHYLYTAVNYIYSYTFKKEKPIPISKRLIDDIYKSLTENEDSIGFFLYATFFKTEKDEDKLQEAVNYGLLNLDDLNKNGYLYEMYSG